MKIASITLFALLLATSAAITQGTFQYDQQSLGFPAPPNVLYDIQSYGPIGQSFIPSLPAVGFVQLELFDGHPNNGLGATVYVNLRSNSIAGPLLGSSDPVLLPDIPSGGGVTNFFFSGPVTVSPGTTYFFEIEVQSGDLWRANMAGDYSSGVAYIQGSSQPFYDLWFREGIIVPEPSAKWLVLATGALWFVVWRRTR
jgi:hypothetical protein